MMAAFSVGCWVGGLIGIVVGATVVSGWVLARRSYRPEPVSTGSAEEETACSGG